MIEEMGIVYKTNTLFGLMVLVWFILNESLSILENAGRMGVKLPDFLVQVLANMKNDINEKK
jgi:phage-related holin